MVWSEAEKVVLPSALLIIVLITLLVYVLTKNKSNFIKKLPLLIVSVVMVVLEIIKQVLQINDYSFWSIPLHFCSFFMFWAMLATFTKSKKWSEIGFSIAVAFGILFLLMFYINPSSIIGDSSQNILATFSTFHTFVYHHLMILFLLLTFSQNQFKPQKNHVLWIFVLYSSYAVLATTFAHLLQVNFTNLLTSNISFMQLVLDKFGIVAYTIIMYFFGLFGCWGAFGASKLVYHKINKNKKQKLKNKNNFA